MLMIWGMRDFWSMAPLIKLAPGSHDGSFSTAGVIEMGHRLVTQQKEGRTNRKLSYDTYDLGAECSEYLEGAPDHRKERIIAR
jgi:hypothetical protein